jgi:archaellum component FlaG (FlaF/FlaG flagellin family)
MTNRPRRNAVFASCVLMFAWSSPLANGSEARASDPQVPSTPTVSTSYAPVPSEFALMVSPTRIAVAQADTGKPAQILVVNRGHSPVPVTAQERDFTGGADGSLAFQDKAPYSASEWVTVTPASFVIAPGATQVVTAAIVVAADPEPGDHQVAIVFLVPAGQTEANVKINRGVATPVYITVTGPTDDSASLSDLSAPGFTIGGGVDVSAKVHNTGTVHRDFRGATVLSVDAAGGDAAFPDFTVIRGATRDISTTWEPPLICVCHPRISFVNADGSVQTVVARVIVFPFHLLGILLVVLALIVLVVRRNRKRRAAAGDHV